MRPNKREMRAIQISEKFYNDKNSGLNKLINSLKFRLKWYKVSKEKTLAHLWNRYGLHSTGLLINVGIKFSDEQKIECIKKWFGILYHAEFDVVADYNYKLKEFNQEMSDYYKSHHDPNIHINWNFPTPEKYLKDIEDKFGNY